MITTFHDRDTENVYIGNFVKRWHPDIQRKGKEKLDLLHQAAKLEDLEIPPGNKLEPLVGDRAGQHSIRINKQWRVCFIWNNGNAERVEICDYH